MAGLAILPVATTAAAAAPSLDAASAQIVARFERLVEEYYARQRDWAPRMAAAHAETDKLFGEGYNEQTNAHRTRFLQEVCDRRGADEAGERLHAVFEEMTPLARAIIALPATSMEALRARALVSFWEVAPDCARADSDQTRS